MKFTEEKAPLSLRAFLNSLGHSLESSDGIPGTTGLWDADGLPVLSTPGNLFNT